MKKKWEKRSSAEFFLMWNSDTVGVTIVGIRLWQYEILTQWVSQLLGYNCGSVSFNLTIKKFHRNIHIIVLKSKRTKRWTQRYIVCLIWVSYVRDINFLMEKKWEEKRSAEFFRCGIVSQWVLNSVTMVGIQLWQCGIVSQLVSQLLGYNCGTSVTFNLTIKKIHRNVYIMVLKSKRTKRRI